MLKCKLLHPEILSGLASAGHLSTVLIADGNFPAGNRPNPRAKVVWANYTPGIVDAATVLRLVCGVVPIEAVHVMAPERTGLYAMTTDPPIWQDFRTILRETSDFRGEMIQVPKPEFVREVQREDLSLVIATAETQIFANILLTIGVVQS
jgi:L-fucose mutarotase